MSKSDATINLATLVPIFKLGKVVNVLGSTGRVVANNIREQMVMGVIVENPSWGRVIMSGKEMSAPWSGWVKMAWNDAGVEIHYVAKWENGIITAVDDFKFK